MGQNQFLLVGRGDSDRSGWAAFGRLVLNEKTPRVTPDSRTALHSVYRYIIHDCMEILDRLLYLQTYIYIY